MEQREKNSGRASQVNKRKLTPFGKSMKIKLVEKEMKQEELAEMVGTSPQYINHIMYGERAGSKYMEKIKEILDMDE